MNVDYILLAAILIAGMLLSVKTGKLTIPASLTGGLVGFLIFYGANFTGLAMVAAVFILGTLATSWKMSLKQQLGLGEVSESRRKASQVAANAGIAALLGFMAGQNKEDADVLKMMMAASLASAMADTLSSELGNVYGRTFYNIVTLRRDLRGLNGVISLEGTIAGLAGSFLIAFIYSLQNGLSVNTAWIVIAGTVGNLADSLLGATLERKGLVGNDVVNLLNTLIAALAALTFSVSFQ